MPEDGSDPSIRPVEKEAIGSLGADWRSKLLLLSRLASTAHPPKGVKYDDLRAPNQNIVDSFNHHITRGHTPNLGHQMVSFLTRLLRIRTVLTINFDSLLETAFARAHFPIEVFDVHLMGNLPHSKLVRLQLSLIKMHGSRFETRADLSLDAQPPDLDHKAFRAYFHAEPSPPAHLLVLGFSGHDKRIMDLIRDMFARPSDDPPVVFWVCHREDEIQRVRDLLGESIPHDRLILTSARADLLLFALYHRFVTTVPPAGSTFEYSQYIPPGAVPFYDDPKDLRAKAVVQAIRKGRRLTDEFTQLVRKSSSGSGAVFTLDGGLGISHLGQACYAILADQGHRVLWFELDDFCNAADLAACILQCVAAQRGQYDLDVITLSPEALDPQAVADHFRIGNGEWFVFIYGRQAAGTSAGWDNSPWMSSEKFEQLWALLEILSKIGLTIIYMPLSERCRSAVTRSARSILETVSGADAVRKAADEFLRTMFCDPRMSSDKRERKSDSRLERTSARVLTDVKHWIHSGGTGGSSVHDRSRFLYVMTLFRQSRHLSALCSEAAYPDQYRFNTSGIDNDVERIKVVEPWTRELARIGLLRPKDGGFLWMHRDLRETLRILLEHADGWAPHGAGLLQKRAPLHHWLAEWYLRAFRATGNFTPFVESAYHRLQCLRHLDTAGVPSHLQEAYEDFAGGAGSDEVRASNALHAYRVTLCEMSLLEAIKLLDSGRRRPVLNLEQEQRIALFGSLPQGLAVVAARYGCQELWTELEMSATRLSTLASAQSRESNFEGSPRGRNAVRQEPLKIQPSARRQDTAEELFEYEARYNKIRSEVAWERFSETKKALVALAKDLQFAPDANPPYGDPMENVLRSSVRAIVHRGSSARWRILIKVLRRLAHTYLKETAIGFHLHEIALAAGNPNVGIAAHNEYKRNAALASSLLLAADRSGWFLDASSRDSQIIGSVACQSLHGLALGYLGRFREAQRKLDEASGALTACSLAHDPMELGILELRRAAVFLLQARTLRNDFTFPGGVVADATDLRRAARASVEDARRCLERARDLLGGNSRIVSWWARLYVNQLRACALAQALFESREEHVTSSDDSPTFSQKLAETAHRSVLLLRPERPSIAVKACHYFVYAAPSGPVQVARAQKCHADLERERLRIDGLPADQQPDSIVTDYLQATMNAVKTLFETGSRRAKRA